MECKLPDCNCHAVSNKPSKSFSIRKNLFPIEHQPSNVCKQPLDVNYHNQIPSNMYDFGSVSPNLGSHLAPNENDMNEHLVGKLCHDHTFWEYASYDPYNGFKSPGPPLFFTPMSPQVINNDLAGEMNNIPNVVEDITLIPNYGEDITMASSNFPGILPMNHALTPFTQMKYTLCPAYKRLVGLEDPMPLAPNPLPPTEDPHILSKSHSSHSYTIRSVEVCNAMDWDLDHSVQSTDRKPNRSIKYKVDPNCAACDLVGGQDTCDWLNGKKGKKGTTKQHKKNLDCQLISSSIIQFKEGSSKKKVTNLMDLIVSSSTGSSSPPVK